MINFISEGKVKLEFDHNDYLAFLDDEDTFSKWYGFSLQFKINRSEISEKEMDLVAMYKELIIEIISFFYDNTWILRHDDKVLPWFKDNNCQSFPNLSRIFIAYGIPFNFKGAIVLDKENLIALLDDLILYPYRLAYKNIDIINCKTSLIIKISSHLNIDIIGMDLILLKSILKNVDNKKFNIIQYR
jgi:hypothetical protein